MRIGHAWPRPAAEGGNLSSPRSPPGAAPTGSAAAASRPRAALSAPGGLLSLADAGPGRIGICARCRPRCSAPRQPRGPRAPTWDPTGGGWMGKPKSPRLPRGGSKRQPAARGAATQAHPHRAPPTHTGLRPSRGHPICPPDTLPADGQQLGYPGEDGVCVAGRSRAAAGSPTRAPGPHHTWTQPADLGSEVTPTGLAAQSVPQQG